MDLKSLNTFIHVAEMQSFTRAGAKLGYSQPTISFQIKQLEEELGVQLFDRMGHTISLTEEGRDALEYAQLICRLAEEMAQGSGERESVSGELRLAMADSLSVPMLNRGFVDFTRKYPQVSLSVTTAGTDELFRRLDHNEADIVCTLDTPIFDTNYIIADQESIGVHFICSADDPFSREESVSVEALLARPFLLTEKGMSYRRRLDEELARRALELQPVLELGRADLICSLVAQGAGISFLPDYVTESAVRAGTVSRIPVEDIDVQVSKQILYHRGKWMSRPMEAVIAHLAEIRLGVYE